MFLAVNAGGPAVVTALGGASASLTSVYFNARKQAREAEQNAFSVRTLSDQITFLAGQVGELRAENASLRTELRILKGKID